MEIETLPVPYRVRLDIARVEKLTNSFNPGLIKLALDRGTESDRFYHLAWADFWKDTYLAYTDATDRIDAHEEMMSHLIEAERCLIKRR